MTSVAFEVVIFVLELREKVPHGTIADEGPSPEETISVFNRLFYFWLNGLLLRGYRTELTEGDMFPLDRGLSSDSLRLRFQTAWEKGNVFLESAYWCRAKRIGDQKNGLGRDEDSFLLS